MYLYQAMDNPKALRVGDTIGIAAPASPFDRKKFIRGIHVLENLGFKAFYRNDIFDQSRYLAGTDSRRAQELGELFSNQEISAIMFARGGYGSQRIIPLLDAGFLSKHRKPVIGFSDVTALLTYLRQSAGVPTFYGPVITLLGSTKSEMTGKSLLKAITAQGALGKISSEPAKTIKVGKASGKITGGCLTIINSSIGTPYELKFEDSILFIEDIGEKVYVLDRMLTQLKNCGALSKVKGIIFGSLIPPEQEPYDVKSMIEDVLRDFHGPVIMDFPAGHIDEFITLPLGADVTLDAQEKSPPTITYNSGILS